MTLIKTSRRLLLAAAATLGLFSMANANPAEPRVLLVLSSHGQAEDGGKLGYDFHEFALAAQLLQANGVSFDIASPKGGAPVGRPAGESTARQVQADAALMARLQATLPTAGLQPADYAAVLVLGGKGPMFDLRGDAPLQQLLSGVWQRGGVLAAVCHGPAALLDLKSTDGRPLLAGRRVTGFSNAEERRFSGKTLGQLPFLLEDALQAQGARYESRGLMLPLVVSDERLITGQNPLSTPPLVEALLRALGRTPVARTPSIEEATMALIERHLAGAAAAAEAGRHDPLLLGTYGLLLSEGEAAPERLKIALAMLAQAHRLAPAHAGMTAALASVHAKLGHKPEAIALLKRALQQQPDHARARQLLAELES
ncbi:type 1 glutamine amidotransferase domain-containing protein [Paucibacter sp. XJ19-41]|uniref:type 1 glutamine amidotransferase domain-containing protein n=1 Tax=Paucibacter sp. XJ19-41 TaxID=2927824 RepID=UPI00234AD209|nr:DJ-1/PfpI family protein [Paucibacter sp. XJ19-41]MDC6167409.1 DJ-1/PfpI family protein [Paucibacter sp. XJ19-41]